MYQHRAEPDCTQATITYSVPAHRRNQQGVYEPANRNRAPTVWFDDRLVAIRDARTIVSQLELDRTGFELAAILTQAWEGGSTRRPNLSVYADELRGLIANRTGAAELIALSIVRRGPGREPLLFAHNDFNFDHGPRRAREVLGSRAGELQARRFSIVQTWQPLFTPIDRNPLAFCDASTVGHADLIPERGTFMIAFNPRHQWYYFPGMRPDEIALFRTYDSATDGRARLAPHSSFNHPATRADAPARQSVESRWLLLYDG